MLKVELLAHLRVSLLSSAGLLLRVKFVVAVFIDLRNFDHLFTLLPYDRVDLDTRLAKLDTALGFTLLFVFRFVRL